MIYYIVSIIVAIAYGILMILYIIGWHWQREKKSCNGFKSSTTFVSIIIPARNEQDNIGALLHSIMANHYPKHLYEIVVIDDFSDDNTAAFANEILKNEQGRVLSISAYLSAEERINSYKKKALEIAISEAKGELIITTDADCIVPKNWISMLVNCYENGAKFIAAPVKLIKQEKSINEILYQFQSLDFMTMQGITAASAALHLGNMCNGANLAFDKKTFYEVGGYKGIDAIASGDDMLLMHKFDKYNPKSIYYLKSTEAIVSTACQPTWSDFLNQRIRWSSKADKYQDKKMTGILALVYFFNLNFLVLLVLSFFIAGYGKLLLILFLGKMTMELLFLIPVALFYKKIPSLFIFPLLQPLHIGYIIFAGFLGKFGSYSWKGRRVK